MSHLFLLFVFYLNSNYVLIFKIFVKTICIELSVNFVLLKFELKYHIAKTLLQRQDFSYRSAVLGCLGEF